MNSMTYKGYTARIDFDESDSIFVGRVLAIKDNISFHGKSVSELTKDFHAAIDHYLADCKATGRKPERSYSGNLMLRISPDTHAHVAKRAAVHRKSINEWVEEVLANAR